MTSPLDRIDALLALLWPRTGAVVQLHRVDGRAAASIVLPPDPVPAAECGAPSLAAVFDALDAHLCDVARTRAAELLAATGDARVRPVDYGAAEDAGLDAYALAAIERRFQPQPAQREASGGAGVPRAIVDELLAELDADADESERTAAVRSYLPEGAAMALRQSAHDTRRRVAAYRERLDACEAQRSADEAHQGGERVGEVAIGEGWLEVIGATSFRLRGFDGGAVHGSLYGSDGMAAVTRLDGQQVRLCVRRVLDGAGHGASVGTSAPPVESPR